MVLDWSCFKKRWWFDDDLAINSFKFSNRHHPDFSNLTYLIPFLALNLFNRTPLSYAWYCFFKYCVSSFILFYSFGRQFTPSKIIFTNVTHTQRHRQNCVQTIITINLYNKIQDILRWNSFFVTLTSWWEWICRWINEK